MRKEDEEEEEVYLHEKRWEEILLHKEKNYQQIAGKTK